MRPPAMAGPRLTPEALHRLIETSYHRMHPDNALRALGPRAFKRLIERRGWLLYAEFLDRRSGWEPEWWRESDASGDAR